MAKSKLRSLLKDIRDGITIVGIPVIGLMGWNLHNEQMNLKNYTIESQQMQIEFFKSQRSLVILEELNKAHILMEKEFKRLNDTIKKLRRMNSDPVLLNKYGDSLEAQLNIIQDLQVAGWEMVDSLDNYSLELFALRQKYFAANGWFISEKDYESLKEATLYENEESPGEAADDEKSGKD